MADAAQPKQYEYLDHTADVQIHSSNLDDYCLDREKNSLELMKTVLNFAGGPNLQSAFEWAAVALFGYMFKLDNVDVLPETERVVEVQAEDLQSLLYTFLEEFVFIFGTEFVIFRKIEIESFDRANFSIKAKAWGEPFDVKKHERGTEIKAITYSAMNIVETPEKSELYVIVDI